MDGRCARVAVRLRFRLGSWVEDFGEFGLEEKELGHLSGRAESPPSLRGAKRRSNPRVRPYGSGLLVRQEAGAVLPVEDRLG